MSSNSSQPDHESPANADADVPIVARLLRRAGVIDVGALRGKYARTAEWAARRFVVPHALLARFASCDEPNTVGLEWRGRAPNRILSAGGGQAHADGGAMMGTPTLVSADQLDAASSTSAWPARAAVPTPVHEGGHNLGAMLHHRLTAPGVVNTHSALDQVMRRENSALKTGALQSHLVARAGVAAPSAFTVGNEMAVEPSIPEFSQHSDNDPSRKGTVHIANGERLPPLRQTMARDDGTSSDISVSSGSTAPVVQTRRGEFPRVPVIHRPESAAGLDPLLELHAERAAVAVALTDRRDQSAAIGRTSTLVHGTPPETRLGVAQPAANRPDEFDISANEHERPFHEAPMLARKTIPFNDVSRESIDNPSSGLPGLPSPGAPADLKSALQRSIRAVELPAHAAMSVDSRLVWREARPAASAARRTRDDWPEVGSSASGPDSTGQAGHGNAAMQVGDSGRAPVTSDSASLHPTGPDVGQLAEEVTRIIVRELDIERERRGGGKWT